MSVPVGGELLIRPGVLVDADEVKDFFPKEQRTYRRNLGDAHYGKRLGEQRVREERLMRDILKKPTPKCEALMARAHVLEDAGELAAAADLYLRVLACEQQADNHHLRAHAQGVLAKVNRKEAGVMARVKQAAFEAKKGTGGPRAGLAPDKDEALDQHRLKVVGGNDRLSHRNEQERERLAKEEDMRRRSLLEWDELKAAAEMSARGPLGGVDEYERRREQVQAAHAHRDVARNAFEDASDQRRLFHAAHGHAPGADAEEAAWHAARDGAGLPHAGAGFHRHSRHAREYAQRLPDYPPEFYHQPGGAAAVGLRQRPASAGATTAAAARDRERAAANAANLARLYVPGHPYGNGGGAGPPPQRAVWPTAAAPVMAAAAPARRRPATAGPRAPYGRPDVDRPAIPIDPRVVRAKQQAYLDKRKKPDPPPAAPLQPLRVRRAAGRRPSPPRVTARAYADGYAPPP
ncbi:hypothetical protein TSOC_011119 [Tetrabaena socialis]|uniref:Uncharacterized protein n=1 Tax=Tetrabaena socialis TaxID=47790 RepID=A0A2J7ZRK6_9CHLO|nr:hypothetical protein TSOC_011119 [Tetrabaena socialis]|eukprot:PNH02870.1 hypothetical protein TSOC_011119 [Tetrabaena socialis]